LSVLERSHRRSGEHSRSVRGAVRLAALLGAVLVVLGSWLLASPPGSSPDDVYHLGSIWCGQGFDERCLPSSAGERSNFALVPSPICDINCYVFDQSSRSAACLNRVLPGSPNVFDVVETNIRRERANLYYATMNLLVGDDVGRTVARIRVVNALTVLTMVLMTALVAGPRIRTAFLVTWLVASLPLGLFMVTSVNTTAWGIAGLGTIWANGLTVLGHQGSRRRVAAGVLAAVGWILAVGSRTEALPHLVFVMSAVVVLAVLDDRDLVDRVAVGFRRLHLSTRLLLVISAGAMLVWIGRIGGSRIFASQFGDLQNGWDRLVARDIGNPFFTLAMDIPTFWVGVLGSWNLGWLDTRVTPMGSVPTMAVYVALLTLGLMGASRARMTSASIIGLGMLLLPLLSLIPIARMVNEEIQARHFIALIYVLLGIALTRDRMATPLQIGRGMYLTMTLALGAAHAAALWMNIGRYTTGFTEFLFVPIGREPEWWWSAGPAPFTVWAAGSVAFLVATFLVLGRLRERSAN
jgi:hypothetical protein